MRRKGLLEWGGEGGLTTVGGVSEEEGLTRVGGGEGGLTTVGGVSEEGGLTRVGRGE